jgi:RimJ/RimL family protein N-acetyltransferase
MAGAVTVTTPRLRLRPVTAHDAAALHALWSLPDVRRFLWNDVMPSPAHVRAACRTSRASWRRGWGLWIMEHAGEDGGSPGFCGFRTAAWERAVELVYALDPAAWGRGLATEAAGAALAYVFGEGILPRVVAAVDVPNEASIRVLRRLGMTEDRRGALDGRDTLFFSRMAEDFAPPPGVRWDRPEGGGDGERREEPR